VTGSGRYAGFRRRQTFEGGPWAVGLRIAAADAPPPLSGGLFRNYLPKGNHGYEWGFWAEPWPRA
jgi:hypothetical protein